MKSNLTSFVIKDSEGFFFFQDPNRTLFIRFYLSRLNWVSGFMGILKFVTEYRHPDGVKHSEQWEGQKL